MKARRTLQIILGVLAILLVAAALFVTVLVAFADKIPDSFGALKTYAVTYAEGIQQLVAETPASQAFALIPAAAHAVPSLFLLLGAVLIFIKNKGIEGKNIAGSLFVLIGGTMLAVFVCVLTYLGVQQYIKETAFAAAISVALIVLFAVLALCVGRKAVAIAPLTAQTEEEQQPEQPAENDQSGDVAEQQAEQPAQESPAVEESYNSENSVSATVNDVYSPDHNRLTKSKIDKLHVLLEMGAITEEEYMKLLQSYLK